MQTLTVSQRPYLQTIEEGPSLGTITSPEIVIQFNDVLTNQWYLTVGTPFYIVCDGFRNPRTTRVTSTFQIYTTDKDGYYLE